jgi:hypothetical protein
MLLLLLLLLPAAAAAASWDYCFISSCVVNITAARVGLVK